MPFVYSSQVCQRLPKAAYYMLVIGRGGHDLVSEDFARDAGRHGRLISKGIMGTWGNQERKLYTAVGARVRRGHRITDQLDSVATARNAMAGPGSPITGESLVTFGK